MNIAGEEYSLKNKSLEIYVSGCKAPHCIGCHNEAIQSFDIGEKYDTHYFLTIQDKIKNFDEIIDNIFILGGEPLDQCIGDITEMLFELNTLNKDIWLFTKYPLNKIPRCILNYCSYVKCGRYIEEKKVDNNIQYGIKLATSNQKIYKRGVDY